MKKLVLLYLVVTILLMLLVITAQAQQYFPPIEGEKACEFTVPLLSGDDFTLTDYLGKVVIVNIWSTTCPFCVQLLPNLQQLVDKYPDTLVMLGFGGTSQSTLDYYYDKGYTFLLGFGDDQNYRNVVGDIFETRGIPYTVVIDPYGVVSTIHLGWVNYATAEGWYLKALNASEPPPGVPINETNFPDPVFRAYMLENYSDSSGCVTRASDIIDFEGIGVSDPTGIEHYVHVRRLTCSNNSLTQLDLFENTALETLWCDNNNLTSLNVDNNTALAYLFCYNNQLAALNTFNSAALVRLSCYDNQLTTLNISNNTALEELNCSNNQLTTLDISNNTALDYLHCSNNQLTAIDVSNNSALSGLYFNGNHLTTLNVSTNTKLRGLQCSDNQLTTLNISNNFDLERLECSNNQLTALDVSNHTALTHLECSGNLLTALDVSSNTVLISLLCSNNLLTTLDVSDNTGLVRLECSGNLLTTLDVSNNIDLRTLYCASNRLSSLDLSGNAKLQSVYLPGQQAGTLVYTQVGDTYQVNLRQLPGGSAIDLSRVSITNGGILDASTGAISYAMLPAYVDYQYDTQASTGSAAYLYITANVSATYPGDANGDGTTDIMDLVVIIDYIVNGNNPASMTGADANGDGTVDIMDLVYIIDLIVNPPVNSGMQVKASLQGEAGKEVAVEVPFSSSSPITALEVDYTLSPSLTFVSADYPGMTGKGGSSNAVFTSLTDITSGTVTLRVKINTGVTTEQYVNVTAVTGANMAGTRSVGIAQSYLVSADASLSILQQPVNTTVVVGSQGVFTLVASGIEPLTYQWYINRNDGSGWVLPQNGTQSQYASSPVTLDNNGYRYFCRVTDTNRETINSETVTLTVVAAPQTGDSSNILWLIALALLAAGGIGAILLYRQNKAGKKKE